MADERFAFGKNWHNFVDTNLDDDRVEISRRYLLDFLERDDLNGVRFLDIGCGSGIHSLAAVRSGAAEVFSFDYDADSVAATRAVKDAKARDAVNWHIERGSVLDEDYMAKLGQYPLVYSWGVLHHTGDLWRAIRNACTCVEPGGLLYIALYSADMHVDPPAEFWIDVKKRYVAGGAIKRNWMMLWYLWRFSLGKNPRRVPELMRTMRDYRKSRGMSYLTDVRDWIGGWPMEFSRDQDVIDLLRDELGFEVVKQKTGEANTEYLFRLGTKPASA
ncbi:MAG: class I SAM-dependent methyltransferase [Gammaproteobacteria bacterium]|nr:class I SAM-dependent methyltransferase [Gammaproteobacteria bacterium]